MERVEFQQEDMLAELKDLEEKGLFSKSEVKMIMKKRTGFEQSLVRRIPKKADYLRYAEYEMALEALRRKRMERIKVEERTPSISDYAMVRRQFYIFERALRKFKSDVGLWVQYIELAKKENATVLVGRISARALQLHPNEPALYIYAAQHEMSTNASPAAARALLQRGLRLNKETEMLWTEYVKFELGFVETLRKRWKTLGVTGGAGEDDEGEEARKEILRGGIVRAVMEEAVKAKPTAGLFQGLYEMLVSYPTTLREEMVAYLDELLVKTLPGSSEGLKLRARWLLPEEVAVDSEEFVERLRRANEALVGQARREGGAVSGTYGEVIGGWCQRDLEPSLRQYLMASLQSLAAQKDVAAEVLATYVRLLAAEDPERAVQRARRYVGRSKDAAVWLARLDAERLAGTAAEEIARIWKEARMTVKDDSVRGEPIWRWGLDDSNGQMLLRESLSMGLRWIHGRLAVDYYAAAPASERMQRLRQVLDLCVGPDFYAAAFQVEEQEQVLEEIYKAWRMVDEQAAALAWAEWLLVHRQSARATSVIGRTRGIEPAWSKIVARIS